MTGKKIRIGIFGGSGYGGSELLRILLFHPNAEIVFVTANEQAGKSVSEVHRNLYGLTDLSFISAPEDLSALPDLDCVFLALPHGQAMDVVPRLPGHVKAIDLSGDFRLRDSQVFEQHYGREHTAMESQSEFVYGLTETNREAVRNARLIANPGCFATGTLLGLAPLGRKRPYQRTRHRRCQDRIVWLRCEGCGQHASSATHEFVLRLQAVYTSTRAGDRTGACKRWRLDQRVGFHDAFVAGVARHLRFHLHGNEGRTDRGTAARDL